jgi:hypothetical protein
MSFSMAARPESLMLQQRQPLASSRNSSEVVDGRLEVEVGLEMVIDFAGCRSVSKDEWEVKRCFTFYILDEENNKKAIREGWKGKQTAVSPKSFIITAIRYPCFSVKMRLSIGWSMSFFWI